MNSSTRSFPSLSGPVAQLGARFHGMEEVVGSIPTRSTNTFNSLQRAAKKRDTLSIRYFLTPRLPERLSLCPVSDPAEHPRVGSEPRAWRESEPSCRRSWS
jgi:hypothetical protein